MSLKKGNYYEYINKNIKNTAILKHSLLVVTLEGDLVWLSNIGSIYLCWSHALKERFSFIIGQFSHD